MPTPKHRALQRYPTAQARQTDAGHWLIEDATGRTLSYGANSAAAWRHLDTMGAVKTSHGGARPGAGRRNLGRKGYDVRLKPEVMERIKQRANRLKQTRSETLEEVAVIGLDAVEAKHNRTRS